MEPAYTSVKIAPSILAADYWHLGEQVAAAEANGADRLHIDVMDGHFVPNLSLGPVIVASLRPHTKLPLQTHLMVTEPDRFLEAFAKAGSDAFVVHQEGGVSWFRACDWGSSRRMTINHVARNVQTVASRQPRISSSRMLTKERII